jgi:D-arabinose 1-dehydrogenase-like Zn-dependent alcohol dehydrogenase
LTSYIIKINISNSVFKMTIPKTMKAAVAESAGKSLVIKDVPVPEPEKGEILIKVHACGVCHSDTAAIEGQMGPG